MSEEVKGFVDPYAKIAEWVQDKPQGDRYEPLLTKEYKEVQATPEQVLESETKDMSDVKSCLVMVRSLNDYAEHLEKLDTRLADRMRTTLRRLDMVLERLEKSEKSEK